MIPGMLEGLERLDGQGDRIEIPERDRGGLGRLSRRQEGA